MKNGTSTPTNPFDLYSLWDGERVICNKWMSWQKSGSLNRGKTWIQWIRADKLSCKIYTKEGGEDNG